MLRITLTNSWAKTTFISESLNWKNMRKLKRMITVLKRDLPCEKTVMSKRRRSERFMIVWH